MKVGCSREKNELQTESKSRIKKKGAVKGGGARGVKKRKRGIAAE
jgi:hypothetical protein